MRFIQKTALLSLSLLIIITGSAVSPALANIRNAFPTASVDRIQLIITLPSFVLIPFSLFSGGLSSKVNKKNLLVIALLLYLIGGLGPSFCNSINEILFFRVVLGAGMGLILPLSSSLIADYYSGEKREEMMGLSNSIANLGSIIASILGGFLALYHWRYIFSVYLLAVFVLLFVLFAFPEPPEDHVKKDISFFINRKLLYFGIIALFLNIGFYVGITNLSLFIEEKHLGNSTTAGFAMSFLTLAGFIVGIILPYLSNTLKMYTIPFNLGIMGLGFILLNKSTHWIQVCVSAFMIGFGFGVIKPILFVAVTNSVSRLHNAFALSIITSFSFLGKFLSPIFLHWIADLFQQPSIDFSFIFVGILFILAAVISFPYYLSNSKKREFKTRKSS